MGSFIYLCNQTYVLRLRNTYMHSFGRRLICTCKSLEHQRYGKKQGLLLAAEHYPFNLHPIYAAAGVRCCSFSHLTSFYYKDKITNFKSSHSFVNLSSSHVPYSPAWVLSSRQFHISSPISQSKESTKVEKTVEAMKQEASEQEIVPIFEVKKPDPVPPKKSIGERIVHELKHYYNGFRLLFIDIYISAKLLWQLVRGRSLSRREHRLLVRTVSDLFRLVPFSIFIIVPFMEFLLPVFLKLFPNMLPSTFQSADDKAAKKQLKVRIEMAKFLQDTLGEMALQGSRKATQDKSTQNVKEFADFFSRIRETGQEATNTEIMKYSKLFEDELTLDNLSHQQLAAVCKLLDLHPIGTTSFLRFQIHMKLRSLKADDKMIKKEGVESLTTWELQSACKARGMRALGMPEDRLRSQLSQWLDLSLNENIPPSLLLLSRALYVPENLPAAEKLKATISSLPDSIATQAKAKIGEMEGRVDNTVKLQLIKDEVQKIKEEKKEIQEKVKEKEIQDKAKVTDKEILGVGRIDEMIDKAKVLEDKAAPLVLEPDTKSIEPEIIDEIEDALQNISAEKQKLMIEKEELEDLKEEMEEYKEDIEELKQVIVTSGRSEQDLKETKAAEILSSQVNRMINKLAKVIDDLEKEKEDMHQRLADSEDKEEIVSIEELLAAMKKIHRTPDDERLKKIMYVLSRIDDDRDGQIKVDAVLKVIELLGQEHEEISSTLIKEIIEMLEKEENLEMVEKIEKALEKESKKEEAEMDSHVIPMPTTKGAKVAEKQPEKQP